MCECNKLAPSLQPLQHPSRAGKSKSAVSHLFPPSPAAGLHADASPRASRPGRELLHIPSSFNDLPSSPSDPSNDRLTRSSQRGYVHMWIILTFPLFIFCALFSCQSLMMPRVADSASEHLSNSAEIPMLQILIRLTLSP